MWFHVLPFTFSTSQDPQEVERERRERDSLHAPAGWSSVLVEKDLQANTKTMHFIKHTRNDMKIMIVYI